VGGEKFLKNPKKNQTAFKKGEKQGMRNLYALGLERFRGSAKGGVVGKKKKWGAPSFTKLSAGRAKSPADGRMPRKE